MASKHSGSGTGKLEFKLSDDKMRRVFTLFVDSRLPYYDSKIEDEYRPTPNEYERLIPSTIKVWKMIMSAFINDVDIENKYDVSPIDSLAKRDDGTKVLVSDNEPYVTVWNYDFAGIPKIFVNSNSVPSEVLAHTRAHMVGMANFYRYAEKLGMIPVGNNHSFGTDNEASVTPDTPSNVTNLPPRNTQSSPQTNQRNTNTSKAFPLKNNGSQIKRTRWLPRSNQASIQLQKGKQEDGKFEKPAFVITPEYAIEDWNNNQFEDKELIALRINPSSPISSFRTDSGSLGIRIPVDNSKYPYTVWVGFTDSDYAFKALRDTLGIDKEREQEIEAGMEIYLDDECYLVLVCNSTDKNGKQLMKDGKPVQYKNFYNILYAPDSTDENEFPM